MASNLFIALGGTGFKVVSGLQEMNNDLYNHGVLNDGESQTDPNYYVYLDTDQVSTDFAAHASGNTTVLDLGPFRPANYLKTKQQKDDINTWFDRENITMPTSDLKAGAKGIRQLVRMGYYYEPNCNTELVALLNQFHYKNKQAIINHANNLDDLKVYVVSGSAGGTGSGIFIDVIYTIWRFFIEQGYNGNMNVKAIILMPNSFLKVNDPDLKLKYKMNGYAFMNELNALIKFGLTNLDDQFHSFVPRIYNHPANANWQPLNAGVIIDDVNDKFAFNQAFLYDTITEFLYTYTFGRDILGRTNKTINNDTRTIEVLLDSALTNSEPDRNLKQVNFFNSFGLLVVQSATAEHFPEYVTDKFKLDILEYLTGISGSSSNSEETGDMLFSSLNSDLSKLYKEFEEQFVASFQTPKLDKAAKADYVRLLKLLNLSKHLPKVSGSGLESINAGIANIQAKLKEVCEESNNKIYTFIQELLFEGVSVNELQILLRRLDEVYYQGFTTEQKQNLEGKKDDEIIKDAVVILKSRAKMHFYYMLSKGSETGNTSGYLDNALNYLVSIAKELDALRNEILTNRYEPFIDSLLSLKENGAKMLVPEVDSLITTHLNKWIVDPNGALVKWYNELLLDLKAQSKTLLVSVFNDNEYKDYLTPQKLDVKKFNKAIQQHLDGSANRLRSESDTYKARMDKSLLQIIAEENCDNALAHLKRFDYPFIKLSTPHTVSKKVFAGYNIQNNPPIIEQIGYNPNEFNDILLDNVQFKHKIVKIVFFHKLSFSDYFNFETLSADFQQSFTKLKKSGKFVSSPFIHKDLAGPEYDGDNYAALTAASITKITESFNELDDIKKQIVLKYALVFYEQFVKAAKAAAILNEGFKDDIVRFDTSDKSIHLGRVAFDNFLGEYDIVAGEETILIDGPVSVQGQKSKVSDIFDYLKANIAANAKLDESAVVNCHRQSYRTVSVYMDKKLLAEVLSGFVDLPNSKIKSDFIEYFISVMS